MICWSHVPLASVFDSTGGPTVKVTTDGAPQTPFNVRKSNKGASASTVLCYAGLCYAVLCWAVLCWAGLGEGVKEL